MNIIPADYLDNRAERKLQSMKEHKIAVWPVKNSVQIMTQVIPSLLKENIYFIDSSKFKQGTTLGETKKYVHAPEMIDQEKIDTVILSITTPTVLEIIDEITKKYPSVKQILYAGDLLQ